MPTDNELLEILGTDPAWLTPDQLSGLTRAQLSGLTPDQLSGLTPDQLSWLTPDQLSGLTPDQLSGLKALQNIPKVEKVYSKILQAVDGGHLEMKAWHTCETTHCVGGWTVVLAGAQGKALETEFGTQIAARLILRASRPEAPLPWFTASNEAAMAFIKARAKEEA